MSLDYEPAPLRAGLRAADGPRPAVPHRAVAPDPRPVPVGCDETRDAIRTFKIERIRDMSLTPGSLRAAGGRVVEGMFERAWDIIADQEPVEVVLRFSPAVAARVREARWHPSQRVDGRGRRLADVAGDRRRARSRSGSGSCQWGDDVEVLAPAALRDDVAATHAGGPPRATRPGRRPDGRATRSPRST